MPNHHIAIPRSTLIEFSNSGRFNYLDLRANKIYNATAAGYNTQESYYPDEIESFLSREIETTIGRIRAKLKSFANTKSQVQLKNTLKEEMIHCLAIQQQRIPDFAKSIRKSSVFPDVLNLTDKDYSPLHRGDYNLINMGVEIFKNGLADHDVNVCILNESEPFSFILPTSHCLNIGSHIFFILSPYRAIVLLPKKDNEKYRMEDGTIGYLKIQNYSVLEPIYKKTIEIELKNEKSRIIGLKNQLEEIQSIIA